MAKFIKKKVLFYIKDPKGGTGTFIKNLYHLLFENGFDVLVIYHNNFLSNDVKQKRIGFYVEKQNKISIMNVFLTLLNILKVARIIHSFKPNYIFSIDIYANLVSIILTRFFFKSINLITSTHINLKKHIFFKRSKTISALIELMIKRLYPMAPVHVTPSIELSSSLEKYINNKKFLVLTIPYFINKKELVRLSKERIMMKKYTLTTFSRLNEQKNVELLIKSVIHINKSTNQKISLQIVGDGELKEYLRRKYISNKLIDFVGWRDNPFPNLLNTKIFVLISNYEAFPYSLLEAMALGKPVIASDIDYGPRELIGNNEFGLLTKNTRKDISSTILKMLIRKNFLFYRKQSRIRVKDFDQELLKNKYLSLFHL